MRQRGLFQLSYHFQTVGRYPSSSHKCVRFKLLFLLTEKLLRPPSPFLPLLSPAVAHKAPMNESLADFFSVTVGVIFFDHLMICLRAAFSSSANMIMYCTPLLLIFAYFSAWCFKSLAVFCFCDAHIACTGK
jgi:hypothetical protein